MLCSNLQLCGFRCMCVGKVYLTTVLDCSVFQQSIICTPANFERGKQESRYGYLMFVGKFMVWTKSVTFSDGVQWIWVCRIIGRRMPILDRFCCKSQFAVCGVTYTCSWTCVVRDLVTWLCQLLVQPKILSFIDVTWSLLQPVSFTLDFLAFAPWY